jgi:hypothetical protein
MKNLCFSILFLCAGFIGLISCGSDDNEDIVTCSIAWGTELQTEFNAITNAAAAYGADDSEANCNALKTAYQTYINALRPYGDCATLTGQNRTDFNNALNDAEASVDTIC